MYFLHQLLTRETFSSGKWKLQFFSCIVFFLLALFFIKKKFILLDFRVNVKNLRKVGKKGNFFDFSRNLGGSEMCHKCVLRNLIHVNIMSSVSVGQRFYQKWKIMTQRGGKFDLNSMLDPQTYLHMHRKFIFKTEAFPAEGGFCILGSVAQYPPFHYPWVTIFVSPAINTPVPIYQLFLKLNFLQ